MGTIREPNPFRVGDRVVFAPDAHTAGWIWSSYPSMRIWPGDVGVVTRIDRDIIWVDGDRGGIAWQTWKRAECT